jgi:hypothetical protein
MGMIPIDNISEQIYHRPMDAKKPRKTMEYKELSLAGRMALMVPGERIIVDCRGRDYRHIERQVFVELRKKTCLAGRKYSTAKAALVMEGKTEPYGYIADVMVVVTRIE